MVLVVQAVKYFQHDVHLQNMTEVESGLGPVLQTQDYLNHACSIECFKMARE